MILSPIKIIIPLNYGKELFIKVSNNFQEAMDR